MGTSSEETDPLLVHTGFLRRLAQQLVLDENDREDLVQEAWSTAYAARRRGDPPPRSPRAWLASVLRSRAANLHRDRAHRADREERTAREEAVDSAEVGRDLEVQQGVLAAVSALDEPYRSAIYLRYYQDLAPKEIARRLGVKVTTVDTRLLRGRRLLRERLSRDFGGPDAWMAALLPLCPPGWNPFPMGTTAGSLAGVGVLGMKLKIALCLVVAATLVVAWQGSRDVEIPPPVVAGETRLEAPELQRVHAGGVREPAVLVLGEQEGESAAVPGNVPAAAEASPGVGASLLGVVLGVDGQPLPAARLRYAAREGDVRLEGVSGADGRFRFEGLPGAGKVVVIDPGWSTVIHGALRRGETAGETTVVAAPSMAVSLRVVSEAGEGLAGAAVYWRVPPSLHAGIARSFESSADVRIEGRTDGAGELRLDLPEVPGAWLRVEKTGYESLAHELLLPAAPGAELSLTLLGLESREETLTGRVVDALGEGIPAAVVELGRLGTRTDEDGRFHFDLAGRPPFLGFGGVSLAPRLTAVAPWHLPVTLEAHLGPEGEPLWPREIVIQLAEEPLAIAGRVIDETGSPLADAVVFLPRTHLVAGRTTLEAEMRGVDEEDEFLLEERTGPDGRFEFKGLLDTDYAVAAFLEGSLLRGQLENVRAGTRGLEIRIDRSDLWREVHGRVVTRNGDGVEGVRVVPHMWTQGAEGPSGSWMTDAELDATRTDADGHFVLEGIPRQHVVAILSHPDLLLDQDLSFTPPGATGADGDILRDCVFEAERKMRFQVALDDDAEATEFRLLDAEGNELTAFAQSARNYNSSSEYFLLEGGLSRHLFVSDRASTLVLLRDGVEVRREPLALVWGEETRLR